MSSSKVSFTAMKEGTAEDFRLIARNDSVYAHNLSARIVEHLRSFAEDDDSYLINRLEHCLQAATRAEKDGADDEWIVAALLHDIGDVLAPHAHAEVSYQIVKNYVREEVGWVVRHHGYFQMYYNKSLEEDKRNSRDKFADHPFYDSAVQFCANWDQCSFDPNYETLPLEHFIPVIERVFRKDKYNY